VGSRTTVTFLVLYVRMGSRTIAWDLIPRWISYNTVSRTAWDRIAWDLVLATAWDLVLATAWDLVLATAWDLVQRGILYSAGSKHESPQICDHEELQHEFVIDV
jgi:hypothetical protein